MEKSILLEASDYLACAVRQRLTDETSQKAKLLSPMLAAYDQRIDYRYAAGEQVLDVIRSFQEQNGGELQRLDDDRKAFLRERLKQDLQEGMKWTTRR